MAKNDFRHLAPLHGDPGKVGGSPAVWESVPERPEGPASNARGPSFSQSRLRH